ncbi:tRNA (N(6)-L-threonylcarbamoyladenosine(37)-C(2))-methylthiotransferase [Candidatus Sumerlaeota bacterium]|nr:tRNA (N(6)-L-threonylcarbamoyladenosine(37)-C(2))-methylthiotransferase [Candidatus Sumerlaeota bacterium]
MNAAIYIETSGCAFNASDSEAMGGVLKRAGYEIAAQADVADVLVLNTCTVKDKTFRNFQKRLRELKTRFNGDTRRRVIIAGCIPKAYEKTDLLSEYSVVGPDAVGRIDEVVRETMRGRVVRALGTKQSPGRSGLPIFRRNPAVEILPIARGCKSACAFCQTRLARGRLISFPPNEILDQARRAIDDGVKIFWVTGQDTGAYGHDNDYPLPRLLRELLSLRADFRVRLGMSSPQWIADRLDEYIEVLGHPKMFKFLHVPLQSGSEKVLRDMRRDGGVHEFEAIHQAFYARFPEGTFVTDLIAGYPTETEEDFMLTLGLVERLGLGSVNCSKFSARPGTAAAQLKLLPREIVAERTKRIMSLSAALAHEFLSARIGHYRDAVVEQTGPEGIQIARTESYRPIHLAGERGPGSWQKVKITGAAQFHWIGEISESTRQSV